MSRRRREFFERGHYVNRVERAAQQAARDAEFRVALETSKLPEATSARCMSDFGAYGAICPSSGACAERAVCWRWAQRQGVILRARSETLKARAGL